MTPTPTPPPTATTASATAAPTPPSQPDADGFVCTEEQLALHPPRADERVLYWGSGSPQAWRVLIALEEKGLAYRSVCVSFSSGVLKTPFFRALNPRQRIPVLVEPLGVASDDHVQDDDADGRVHHPDALIATADPATASRVVLYESGAILEYLERRFPRRTTMPTALPAFAIAQTRLHEANELLSVVGDLVVYLRRFPAERRLPAVVHAKWSAVETELAIWERYLDGQPYLVPGAERPFLCDFTLFTNVAYAVRCGLQLDGLFPRLAMFYVRLCARPSIDRTWPPHWRTTFGTKVLTRCFHCAVFACICGGTSNSINNTNIGGGSTSASMATVTPPTSSTVS